MSLSHWLLSVPLHCTKELQDWGTCSGCRRDTWMAQKLWSSYLTPHPIPAAIIIIIYFSLTLMFLSIWDFLSSTNLLEAMSWARHKLWDCPVGAWINKGWIHLDLHFCKAEPSCPNDGAGFLWGFSCLSSVPCLEVSVSYFGGLRSALDSLNSHLALMTSSSLDWVRLEGFCLSYAQENTVQPFPSELLVT